MTTNFSQILRWFCIFLCTLMYPWLCKCCSLRNALHWVFTLHLEVGSGSLDHFFSFICLFLYLFINTHLTDPGAVLDSGGRRIKPSYCLQGTQILVRNMYSYRCISDRQCNDMNTWSILWNHKGKSLIRKLRKVSRKKW